jgi:hypothetical protein
MSKATLLAVCVLGVGAVILLMAVAREPAGGLAAAIPPDAAKPLSVSASNDIVVVNSSSKADRLHIGPSVDTAKVVSIEPPATAPASRKIAEPKQTDVKSWHWNARSNKITRQ